MQSVDPLSLWGFRWGGVQPHLPAPDPRREPGLMRVPLTHYPGMNRFVLDWLNGDERFLPRQESPRRTRTIAPELVTALDRSNRHWGIFAKEQLQRWGAGETYTIVAGQQVGFAGGPLYTLAKLASLLKMKRTLEAQGTPVTVFF